MALTKQLGKPPRAIAEDIVRHLDVQDICETPAIAGPGFINLTLKSDYLERELQRIELDDRLGVAPVKHPQRIIVDFRLPIRRRKCTWGI